MYEQKNKKNGMDMWREFILRDWLESQELIYLPGKDLEEVQKEDGLI